MVCQNTLFAVLKSSSNSNLSPNPFQALSLDRLTFVAVALRASEHCERSSIDDLFVSQAVLIVFVFQFVDLTEKNSYVHFTCSTTPKCVG